MSGSTQIIDNINISNTTTTSSIVSLSNNNITFAPNGTGLVIIDGLAFPASDGTNTQALTTDGNGVLSFSDQTAALTRTVRNVTATPDTVSESDDILNVTLSLTTPVTMNLPVISGLSGLSIINIVDAGGNSALNNITITPNGSDTIIGEASLVINSDYETSTIYSESGLSNWFIL
jgi:hypothetical protein